MFRVALALLLTLVPVLGQVSAQAPKGTLVIVGGGKLPPSVIEAFVAASGGKGAVIGVLPTASGVAGESFEAMREHLKPLGVEVKLLAVKTRLDAERPHILEAAKSCTGFWFTGGDQRRIHDAVVGTSLHRVIAEGFRTGASVGGTSAGAAAMTRIMIEGTDNLAETAPGSYKTIEGLGFLRGCIVDQHFLRRSRHNRLLSLVMEHPDHLALGIDEETALVVKGDQFRVVGNRRVIAYDPGSLKTKQGSFRDLRVHLLAAGQGMDLITRSVLD